MKGELSERVSVADGERVNALERELEDVEQEMAELEREREASARRITSRRVQQVTTLQELGLLEAAGKESSRWRSEADLKEDDMSRYSPLAGGGAQYSPLAGGGARYSPSASSSSSHASAKERRKISPPILGSLVLNKLRTGSDPSLHLHEGIRHLPEVILSDEGNPNNCCSEEKHHHNKGFSAKLSPRLGRRNPLRMLSNAIDFRSRRKQRPKSADFENVDEGGEAAGTAGTPSLPPQPRSSSVSDILETVTLSPSPRNSLPSLHPRPPPPRVLEGRNSAPDIIRQGGTGTRRGQRPLEDRLSKARTRLAAAASIPTKQKLSTRFQPQRKMNHRLVPESAASSSVKRAKTFSVSGAGLDVPDGLEYKTLPKQPSSRSLSSTDSQGSLSTGSSRKSSNSSNMSDSSSASAAVRNEVSKDAIKEIAAFEKFIDTYFQNCENNNTISQADQAKTGTVNKQKVSSNALLEVLELAI